MGVSNREVLDIIEIIYYVPALLVSLWVILKHGHGRQSGWIYLAILAILRLVGASTGIAAIHNPSQSLIEVSTITFSVGLSPLLLALLGIIKRVTEGMQGHGIPPKFLTIMNIPMLIGLVLAIVGGTKAYGSDHSDHSNDYTYLKAAIIIFILGYLGLAAMSAITFGKRRSVLEGEMRLVLAALVSLPFIGVRLIYASLSIFDHDSAVFGTVSTSNTTIIVRAIMSVSMEFIVVAIYLTAGILVRQIPRSMVKQGYIDPPSYDVSSARETQQTGTTNFGNQARREATAV